VGPGVTVAARLTVVDTEFVVTTSDDSVGADDSVSVGTIDAVIDVRDGDHVVPAPAAAAWVTNSTNQHARAVWDFSFIF
jgi:hypothetical protein